MAGPSAALPRAREGAGGEEEEEAEVQAGSRKELFSLRFHQSFFVAYGGVQAPDQALALLKLEPKALKLVQNAWVDKS